MARRPWWVNCKWSVEALTSSGWKEIYCTRTKKTARTDATGWEQRTGQRTKIVPGEGHPSRRSR